MFKKAGLGPLIGKRSWGGVVGITNRGPLQDGGAVNVPEFGFASPEGQWIIEGEGVAPDIVVEKRRQVRDRGQGSATRARHRRSHETDQRRAQEAPGPPGPAGEDPAMM
jgi:C-terminal processing protease CtpA/Prc